MIAADFSYTRENDICIGFSVRGHAGYAESGEDIVCSAVSSAVYMTANTITEVIKAECEINERDGLFRLKLKSQANETQLILEGLRLHLTELAKQYPRRITVRKITLSSVL